MTVDAELSATGLRFAIIASRYNHDISRRLLQGAINALISKGATEKDLDIFWVPGSFELPQAAKKIVELKRFDAVICIGAVIRGETLHFELISNECARGIQETARDSGIPLSFGVITANNLEQALARSAENSENKGWEAAMAAIEMANLYEKLERLKKGS